MFDIFQVLFSVLIVGVLFGRSSPKEGDGEFAVFRGRESHVREGLGSFSPRPYSNTRFSGVSPLHNSSFSRQHQVCVVFLEFLSLTLIIYLPSTVYIYFFLNVNTLLLFILQ